MYRLIKSSKELSRGVFWEVDDQLFAYPFYNDTLDGIAKADILENFELEYIGTSDNSAFED